MHQAELILRVHLSDKKATISSIGVLYGLLIAASAAGGQMDWEELHKAIRAHFPPMSYSEWIKKLSAIKDHGWRLFNAVAKASS